MRPLCLHFCILRFLLSHPHIRQLWVNSPLPNAILPHSFCLPLLSFRNLSYVLLMVIDFACCLDYGVLLLTKTLFSKGDLFSIEIQNPHI